MIGLMRSGEISRRLATLLAPATLAACAPAELPPRSSGAAAAFLDVTAESGLDFDFDRAAHGDYFMPDSMAAGCALLDFDVDGDLDVYIVNGYWSRDGGRPVNGANRLYRQGPDGRFVDVTAGSGSGDLGYGMGVAVGDIDNDGDPDLFVSNYGADALYRNEGDGRFSDVTAESGLGDTGWGASAGFLDYDADGRLDLFVTRYLELDPSLRTVDSAGRPEYPGPTCCAGVTDLLYRNLGDGRFADVSVASGIAAVTGRGLGTAFVDLDRDGRIDIYVANDGEANRAWVQRDGGTFVDRATELGIALNVHGGAEAGMGIAVGDLHGRGSLDLLVTHLSQESNTLYRAESGGGFSDATLGSGLGASSVDFTGFGATLLDVDLDGLLDPLVINGRVLRAPVRDGNRLGAHWAPYAEANLLYANEGDGRFRLALETCGTLCSEVEVGRGLAAGDIDNDGDLDVLLSNGNGTVRLYRNVRPRDAHWIAVRAVDAASGRDLYGSVVRVAVGGRTLRRDVTPVHSYLSSADPRAYFGLGDAGSIDGLDVTWPDGTTERFGALGVDAIHLLRPGEGQP